MTLTARDLVEAYFREAGGAGSLERIAALAHEDMVDEANQAFGGPPGRAGLLAHVKGFWRAIADLRVEVGRIAVGLNDAGAEEAMACWRFTGRHVAPWLGRDGDGAAISGDVISIFTLREGKIAHYRLWLCAQFADGAVVFDSTRALAKAARG